MLHGWGVLPGRMQNKKEDRRGWGVLFGLQFVTYYLLPTGYYLPPTLGWGVLLGRMQNNTANHEHGWGVLLGLQLATYDLVPTTLQTMYGMDCPHINE